MIIYDDGDLEKAFLGGELPVAVMLSARLSADGSFQVTTLRSAAHIAKEYLARFRKSPFSSEAVEYITDQANVFFNEYNYDSDGADILCEFKPKSDIEVPVIDDALLTVADGLSFGVYQNLLDADFDEGICAGVTVGESIVCAAGLNDYSDSEACEIYVECAPEYRRRGYGRAAVLALCKYLIDSGETVIYKTYSSNKASLNLARSCGFTSVSTSLVAVGYSRFETDEK